MAEWEFLQKDASERLAKLEHFSVEKEGVEFVITVREYVSPPDPSMKFFAGADQEINRKSAPFRPVGWGGTKFDALRACLQEIRKFPVEK